MKNPNLLVFYKNGFLHINRHLADVLYIIADPFEVFGDEKSRARRVDFARVLRHCFHQFGDQAVVNFIDFLILFDQLARLFRIV